MKIFFGLLIFILSAGIVFSHAEEDFEEAEQLIESKIPCNDLTEEQLEHLGDYYMEQMHPGEAHEVMDERMGGEGSESLRQMHINMARSFYCGENDVMSSGMMDIMMGRSNMGMMNYGGMMNMVGGENTMAYGMMGSTGMFLGGIFGLIWFALAVFIFSIIFWSTYNWMVKQKKK